MPALAQANCPEECSWIPLAPEREPSCPASSLATAVLSASRGPLDPVVAGGLGAGTNRVLACVHCRGFGGLCWAARGHSSAWNRLGRLTGGQGVGGSNPLAPTILSVAQELDVIRHSGVGWNAPRPPTRAATNGRARNGYCLHALQRAAAQASRVKRTGAASACTAANCPRVKWADPVRVRSASAESVRAAEPALRHSSVLIPPLALPRLDARLRCQVSRRAADSAGE